MLNGVGDLGFDENGPIYYRGDANNVEEITWICIYAQGDFTFPNFNGDRMFFRKSD